jgi:hypothetical protein
LVTVATDRLGSVVPVARLFVASPSEPPDLGPVLADVVDDLVRRPARVGEWGPDDDVAGRIVLSLVRKLSASERCLPVSLESAGVGERWRYTIVASQFGISWTIEEPSTLMEWSGSQLEFRDRCATFGPVFW